MAQDILTEASTTIDAPVSEVWDALVTPETIKRYMFGTNVSSDWKKGSRITWKGEWKGKPYEDRGVILDVQPRRRLSYSHYSPLSGQPDTPENQHTVTIDLTEEAGRTRVTLTQDNNATDQAREHSETNWQTMLDGLRQLLEKK